MDGMRSERIKGEVKVEQAGDKTAEARQGWGGFDTCSEGELPGRKK